LAKHKKEKAKFEVALDRLSRFQAASAAVAAPGATGRGVSALGVVHGSNPELPRADAGQLSPRWWRYG
jgi:hypothetical protein